MKCKCGKEMKVYTRESIKHSPLLTMTFWKCECGNEKIIKIKPN